MTGSVQTTGEIMALIHCEACGKQVSGQALACPNCGHPIGTRILPPAAPLPPATLSSIGRRFGKFIVGLLALVIAVVVLLFLGVFIWGAANGVAHSDAAAQPAPAPPPPKAEFAVSAVNSNEDCTELGDYCVRALCTYFNKGDGPGAKTVGARLLDHGNVVGTREATLTLLPSNSQTLQFDFKEAELGDEHEYRVECTTQ
jgi:hypothetical protein